MAGIQEKYTEGILLYPLLSIYNNLDGFTRVINGILNNQENTDNLSKEVKDFGLFSSYLVSKAIECSLDLSVIKSFTGRSDAFYISNKDREELIELFENAPASNYFNKYKTAFFGQFDSLEINGRVEEAVSYVLKEVSKLKTKDVIKKHPSADFSEVFPDIFENVFEEAYPVMKKHPEIFVKMRKTQLMPFFKKNQSVDGDILSNFPILNKGHTNSFPNGAMIAKTRVQLEDIILYEEDNKIKFVKMADL